MHAIMGSAVDVDPTVHRHDPLTIPRGDMSRVRNECHGKAVVGDGRLFLIELVALVGLTDGES